MVINNDNNSSIAIMDFLSTLNSDKLWQNIPQKLIDNMLEEFNRTWQSSYKEIYFFFNHRTKLFFISQNFWAKEDLAKPGRDTKGNYIRFAIKLNQYNKNKYLLKYIDTTNNNKKKYLPVNVEDFISFFKTALYRKIMKLGNQFLLNRLNGLGLYSGLVYYSEIFEDASIYQKIYFCANKNIKMEGNYSKEEIIKYAETILNNKFTKNEYFDKHILDNSVYEWLHKFYYTKQQGFDSIILILEHLLTVDEITYALMEVERALDSYDLLKEIETLTKNTTISKISRKNILKKLNISDFSSIHSNFSKIWNLSKIFDFLNQEDYIFNIANSNKNNDRAFYRTQVKIKYVYYKNIENDLSIETIDNILVKPTSEKEIIYMYKKDFILINSFFEQNKHINRKEYFPDSIKIEYIDDLDERTKDRFI